VPITIVIPTHNRYSKLRSLLSSIREHWDGEIDSVIVIDDSDAKQVLNGFEDIHLRHLEIGSRIFISKAKNLGWKKAQTELVYFIDDDNIVGAGTISHALRTISSNPNLAAVMPSVLYNSRRDLVWVYATPFRKGRLDLDLVGRNHPRDPSFEDRLLRTDALPNASLVRRIALEDVGGFDERLVVNSSLDFCQRLKRKGWQVVGDSAAFIFHDVEAPGKTGWWAVHGSVDPDRVRYELRDWFLVMQRLHQGSRFVSSSSAFKSLRFVLPNLLAYMLRGRNRLLLVKSLIAGYADGFRQTH
jgi:GT2 family glycosyltransferase